LSEKVSKNVNDKKWKRKIFTTRNLALKGKKGLKKIVKAKKF